MNSPQDPAARAPESGAPSSAPASPSTARPVAVEEYWKKLEAAGLTRPVPFHALIIAPWPFPRSQRPR